MSPENKLSGASSTRRYWRAMLQIVKSRQRGGSSQKGRMHCLSIYSGSTLPSLWRVSNPMPLFSCLHQPRLQVRHRFFMHHLPKAIRMRHWEQSLRPRQETEVTDERKLQWQQCPGTIALKEWLAHSFSSQSLCSLMTTLICKPLD